MTALRFLRQILITEFGTDHFYQADGSFSATPMPWLSGSASTAAAAAEAVTATSTVVRPACVFSGPHNDSYIGNCAPPTGPNKCGVGRNLTLASAQAACAADLGCGGVNLQCDDGSPGCVYTTRADRFLSPDPPHHPATSWIITNVDVCHGPPPPPPPPPLPDATATRYSQAAYAGMARTDAKATWVYQTWLAFTCLLSGSNPCC